MVHNLQQSRTAEKYILIGGKDQDKHSFWKSVKIIEQIIATWSVFK